MRVRLHAHMHGRTWRAGTPRLLSYDDVELLCTKLDLTKLQALNIQLSQPGISREQQQELAQQAVDSLDSLAAAEAKAKERARLQHEAAIKVGEGEARLRGQVQA